MTNIIFHPSLRSTIKTSVRKLDLLNKNEEYTNTFQINFLKIRSVQCDLMYLERVYFIVNYMLEK